ncbi:MAG: ABC transporter ATP-binding protein, partial [Clostridium sp.]
MFKLIKYLKNSTLPIIIIIGLLVVQAVCDLSLPDYTSDIVNVGIQQGGVKNAVPEIIREDQLQNIMMFVNDEDKSEVMDNYIILDKADLTEADFNKYVEKYPELANQKLYKLNTKNKNINEKLNNIFGKPVAILSAIEKDSQNENKIRQGIVSEINAQGGNPIPESIGTIELLKNMPSEVSKNFGDEMGDKFNELSDSMITQLAVPYIHAEYEAVGLDTSKLQSNFILKSGGLMVLIALVSMAATVTVAFIGAKVAANLGRNLRGKVFKKVV